MVQVRIGSRVYDAVYQSNCHTCIHPARMLIEEKILQGYSFRSIADLYSEKTIDDEGGQSLWLPKIGHMSIYNHFHNGHMPLEAEALRKLSERRAKQIGSRYEEEAGKFVDHMVLAEAVVARAYDRLVLGEIEPEVKDGLAAAKFIAEVEANTNAGLDAEAWSDALTVYFETARMFMDDRTWQEFTIALARNPILRALERRLSPDSDVIDAEPVAIGGSSTS